MNFPRINLTCKDSFVPSITRPPFFHSMPNVDDGEAIKNSVKLNDYLNRKDYASIIKDSDLFWLAYGKALFSHQKKEKEDLYVSIQGETIRILGNKSSIKKMQTFIEEIRQVFLECLENKQSSEILLIDNADTMILEKESSLIDIEVLKNSCFSQHYVLFIQPILPELARLCGGLYTGGEKIQKVRLFTRHISKRKAEVIRITLQHEFHLVYPISPYLFPEKHSVDEKLYSLYQKQEFCDFSLISKEGMIKIHSLLLYAYGGTVFSKLLTSGMIESKDKSISLEGYSKSTVQAFIEFIYLGAKVFCENVIASHCQRELNLFELFTFANVYDIQPLIDGCTNLISLFATKEDLTVIQALATEYNNKHLTLLCNHFLPKVPLDAIKI